jgi:hypothetical protein
LRGRNIPGRLSSKFAGVFWIWTAAAQGSPKEASRGGFFSIFFDRQSRHRRRLICADRECGLQEIRLQITRQKMVSTTVLSLLTMTDLETFHKSPRRRESGFFTAATSGACGPPALAPGADCDNSSRTELWSVGYEFRER